MIETVIIFYKKNRPFYRGNVIHMTHIIIET